MNFKMLSEGLTPNYTRVKKDYHKNKVYYHTSILEKCRWDQYDVYSDLTNGNINDYNDIHFVFMFNLPLRKNISKDERELINRVKREIPAVHQIDNPFNYNSVYMSRHKILLLNPEIIRHLPKGIKPYLLSKEHFDIGWGLSKKHIFECFLMHLKSISKHLKQQNETRI